MQRVPISMVEVEGNKANKNRKSIYVTVRVNPHVPGPMETRNRGQKVGRSKKNNGKTGYTLRLAKVLTKLTQRGNNGDNARI